MTAKDLVSLIVSDPWSWLWDTGVQVEAYAVLGPLWRRASPESREAITTVILNGMPREMFRASVGDEEWEQMNDRARWDVLARLMRDAGGLTKRAADALASIQRRYPDWELSGQPSEDFPVWTTTGYGYRNDIDAETLSAPAFRGDFETVRTTLMGGGHNRDGRLQTWEGVVAETPTLAPAFLSWWSNGGDEIDPAVLGSTLRGLNSDASSLPLDDWWSIVGAVPVDAWGSALHPLARAVGSLVEDSDVTNRRDRLLLWDAALDIALRTGTGVEGADPLNDAINKPVGQLTDGFGRLIGRVVRTEEGLPALLLDRVEGLVATADGGSELRAAGEPARVTVYVRLSLFFGVEPDWTLAHLVPRLDWEDPEEAALAWSGFLWSPGVGPDLWDGIKDHALAACWHFGELGRHRSDLAGLLVAKYVEGYPLKADELRAALRSVDDAARRHAVHQISKRLEGAGEKSGQLWRSRVGPMFRKAWPKEKSLRSKDLTLQLAPALLRTGDAFLEAVEDTAALLVPLGDPGFIIRKLSQTAYPDDEPGASLQYLEAVVARGRPLGRTDLGRVLERIEAAGATAPPWLVDSSKRSA